MQTWKIMVQNVVSHLLQASQRITLRLLQLSLSIGWWVYSNCKPSVKYTLLGFLKFSWLMRSSADAKQKEDGGKGWHMARCFEGV
jgi:hypothetical protein